MRATQQLHDLGQSLWLDNIARDILNDGTLRRDISELSVTGLTSNPTIFDHAITNGAFYDSAIRRKAAEGKSGEALFFELAVEDLVRAADLFRTVRVDATALAARLQREGAASFDASWKDLLGRVAAKQAMLAHPDHAMAGRP